MSALTQADLNVLENAAKIHESLAKAARIVREAIALESSMAGKRRELDELQAAINTRKAEALDAARQAVEAQAAHQRQVSEHAALLEQARTALARTREEHVALVNRQAAEAAEALSALRQRHAAQVDAFQQEIARLTATRDDLAAEVDRLKAKFA